MHSAGTERSGVQPNLWTKQQRTSSRPSGARDRGQARSGGGSAVASAAGSVLSWLFGVLAALVRAIGRVVGALLSAWFKLVRKSRPVLIVSVCAIALVVVCAVDGVSHAGRAYSGVKVGDIDVSGLSAQETIRLIREQDGLVVAPHPFSLHCPCLKHKIEHLDIDGIEVLNGGHIDDYSNAEAERNALSGRWARLGGSDSHYIKTVGYAYTNFLGSTAEELRQSILRKNTSVGGVPIPMTDAIAWSMQVVYHSDILILRNLLGLDKEDTDDPIVLKVRGMNAAQRMGALVGSLVYLTPPIPFLVGMTSKRLFRRWALHERTDSKSMGPIWHQ